MRRTKRFSGIERGDELSELDNGELGEQKCTQKKRIMPGPTKKWRIKRIDEVNDGELDEFYCTMNPPQKSLKPPPLLLIRRWICFYRAGQ